MAGQAISIKPIPAFYCVYVLRSTVRNASLYIGSTPNPPRRLKQHNGHVKGGARRTAHPRLRPWEMATIVSGFPSAVAALKFEWALNNAHLTLHIPAELRLSVAIRRKRGGRPRRPIPTLKSIIANIHLLTGVASFARWPLSVHFFRKDALAAWKARVSLAGGPARPELPILSDFSGGDDDDDYEDGGGSGGIHALKLDYSGMEEYVEKASEVLAFEREGKCVHCGEELRADKGLFPMCPGAGCEAMGHLDCWSRYALRGEADEGEDVVIPRGCDCPACGERIRWGEMMKELSLRVRGKDEVEKVLKRRRRAKKAAGAS